MQAVSRNSGGSSTRQAVMLMLDRSKRPRERCSGFMRLVGLSAGILLCVFGTQSYAVDSTGCHGHAWRMDACPVSSRLAAMPSPAAPRDRAPEDAPFRFMSWLLNVDAGTRPGILS